MVRGRSGISEERIRRLAVHCGCDDMAYVDALAAMAMERGKGWWEKYRGILAHAALDLAEAEHHAVRMRTFQMAHIPGLLQTEEYARAVFRYASPDLPPDDLDTLVAFRLHRRQAITDSPAKPYEAVIHEAALRIRVGGLDANHAQLKQILELSELPHVTVRVLPFATEDFAGAGLSMLYLHGPTPQLDTLQIDTGHGSAFLDTEPLLRQRSKRYGLVAGSALAPAESQDLIIRLLQEL